jgi:thiol-disulfide isomerase/thioredoxin
MYNCFMKIKQKQTTSVTDKIVLSLISLSALTLLVGGVSLLGVFSCGISVCAKEVKAASSLFVDARPENLDAKKNNIIFFHAKWCSNCAATIKDFQINQDKKPDSVVIYDVDPDDSKNFDLTKKYNITAYPTFIKVDSQGNQLDKLVGRTTLNEFLTALN